MPLVEVVVDSQGPSAITAVALATSAVTAPRSSVARLATAASRLATSRLNAPRLPKRTDGPVREALLCSRDGVFCGRTVHTDLRMILLGSKFFELEV